MTMTIARKANDQMAMAERASAITTFRVERLDGEEAVLGALNAMSAELIASPFQQIAWLENWFRTVARSAGSTPHLLVARCDRSGRVCLALPLIARTLRGVRRIDAADLGLADYVAPLVAPDFMPDADTMNRLWAEFGKALPPADIFYLGKIAPRIGTIANPLLQVAGVHPHRQEAWGTHLGAPPLDFTALGMTKKRSRELNNRWQRLAAIGEVRFAVAETREEKDRAFAAMCRQRGERFKALGRPNSLDTPAVRQFYRNLLDQYDGQNGAIIQTLSVGDDIIATGLGLVSPDAFLMIFPTIAGEQWRAYSPGLQHFRKSMKWACEHGRHYYDFTLGSEAYKAEFGAKPTRLYEIVQPLTLKGHIVAARHQMKRAIHQRPKLVQFLRRMRQALPFGGK